MITYLIADCDGLTVSVAMASKEEMGLAGSSVPTQKNSKKANRWLLARNVAVGDINEVRKTRCLEQSNKKR